MRQELLHLSCVVNGYPAFVTVIHCKPMAVRCLYNIVEVPHARVGDVVEDAQGAAYVLKAAVIGNATVEGTGEERNGLGSCDVLPGVQCTVCVALHPSVVYCGGYIIPCPGADLWGFVKVEAVCDGGLRSPYDDGGQFLPGDGRAGAEGSVRVALDEAVAVRPRNIIMEPGITRYICEGHGRGGCHFR